MKGIIKKFDPQGFGIIEGTDGSKLPFILSDFDPSKFPARGKEWFSQSVGQKGRCSPTMSLRAGTVSTPLATRVEPRHLSEKGESVYQNESN